MTAVAAANGAGPMIRLATVLRCTEGQAYTVLLGTVVTVLAVALGIPPTLRDRTVPFNPPGLSAAAPAVSSADPTTPDPQPEGTALAPSGGVGPAVPTAPPLGFGPPAGSWAPPGFGSEVTPLANGFGPARVAAEVGQPGSPEGVAAARDGTWYVATNNSAEQVGAGASKVFRYGRDGVLTGEVAIAGQDVPRSGGITGLVLRADGRVYALDTAPARVLLLDVDRGAQGIYATLPDLPACGLVASADACEPGLQDRAPRPRGAALDAAGTLYVTDAGQRLIWRIAAGGAAEPWYEFAGSELAGPTGIALDPGGDLVVLVPASLGSVASGALVRIPVRFDGSAGAGTAFARTDPLDSPIGLAVAPDGAIVVALTGADELLLLGPDGAERARLTAEAVAESAGVPLDGPAGVAVVGGMVLVTNQSPNLNEASHWVVFKVPLTP